MRTKIILASIAIAFVALPALAGFHGSGNAVGRFDYSQYYYQGQGGEFRLEPDGGNLSTNAYASVTKDRGGVTGSFQTFCVETDEYVYDDMYAFVSTSSVAGGAGSHAWRGGDDTDLGDDLDFKTAWLYTQFAKGTLSGYHFSTIGTDPTSGLTRAQSAGALQRFIWYIEGEGGSLTAGSTHQSITLSQDQADAIAAWDFAYGSSGWSGIGDVRILQMCDSSGNTLEQDQLYLVPAPGAALLGVLGLGLVGWLKRRMS